VAGDSAVFDWSHPDYPATAGWSATFYVAGVDVDSFAAVAEDDAHRFTIPIADSQNLAPGQYEWHIRVTDGTTAATPATGVMQVLPDPAAQAAGDRQPWAEVTLPIVEAALRGHLTDAVRTYMIGDTQVVKMSAQELQRWRTICRNEIALARGQFGAPVQMVALPGSR
jgi:hypothetical protein